MSRTVMASLAAHPGPLPGAPGGRILVVEDETVIRELIAQVLQEEGYQIEQAANGAEALAKLKNFHPDAIVLDLMMPVMDGWAFANAWHALATGEAIPILIMSASPNLPRSAEQLRPYGVRAAIAKPFDLDVLLVAVARLAARPVPVEWPG